MTDPTDPLAYLYAEDGSGDLDDVVPNRTTTLEDLVEEGPEIEEVSDEDVVELAIMVRARQDAGTSSDEFLAELGLGEFRLVTDPETDEEAETVFELNTVGLRVVWQMAQDAGLVPKGAKFGG